MALTDQPPLETPAHEPAPKRRRLAPLTTLLCALYILAVVALVVILRLTGEQWWLATILLFSPRWLWITPVVVLLPMALLFRRRLILPVFIAGATVLFAVMGFRIPWRRAIPAGSAHQTLRIFTCNLHGRQAKPELLDQLVDEARPDIILLQDYTASRKPALVKTGTWYTDRFEGIYIASRFPLHRLERLIPRDAAAMAYASHGWPLGQAMLYQVDVPGTPIHLINLHLASPHQQISAFEYGDESAKASIEADSARRTFESSLVAQAARQIGGSFIIAGDFNTPDDSPLFRLAWRDFDDAFDTAGFGFGATYANHHTWLRIDHVLSDPSWRCTQCWAGPPIGSGHRPVVAVLQR